MNELSLLFENVQNDTTVVLENKVYNVSREDSFVRKGYYCTNTAKQHENPVGERFSAIFLKNKKNITIDGNGAVIMVYGKMTPLLFDECENITVKNMTIDYAFPTMAEFRIVSNENGKCVIEINKDCLFRVDGNNLIWQGVKNSEGIPEWENLSFEKGRYIKILNPVTKITRDFDRNKLCFDSIAQLNENTLEVVLSDKEVYFPAGCIVQTRNIVRDQTGSLFNWCRNLYFENMRIKFMHGLGMVSQFCENVTYRNCDFTPAQGRTIASTADFFQFSGCSGLVEIDNCKAFGAQDDYVNVHGTHLRIVDADYDKKSIIVRFMHAESWGFKAFEKGDELEFIKWNTLIPFGKTTVKGYERLNDTDIRLGLSAMPVQVEIGRDVVENATRTPRLYVHDCDFGPTSGRGVLCTTRGGVLIENNSFRNLWGPALLLEDDCNFWFESGYTTEVVFRNNLVSGCAFFDESGKAPVIQYTPKVLDEKSESFVHDRLVVSGNRFEKSYGDSHIFRLEYLREAEITDNTSDCPIVIEEKTVGTITKNNNTIL